MTRIAVDALNLRADERGMGRYVRPVLQTLTSHAGIELTLLVHDHRDAAVLRAIAGDQAKVAALRTARLRDRYDAVWYPWNGVRFAAHAPALVTINDDFAFTFPASGVVARWREQRPILRAVRCATRFATISSWSRDRLAARFGIDATRIGIIPLRPNPFFSPGRQTSPFAEPFVLAVGGSEPRKNIPFLVDVFCSAFPNGDVRLVIVGSVDTATQRVIATSVVPIDVLGNCDNDELRSLYRTASAVAVPSLAEGFGLVTVEAQACGAAVIAANASALPEAVGEAGLLVDLGDRGGWIAALRNVVRDNAVRSPLCARGIARWAQPPRENAASAVLALLHGLVDDRA